MQPFHGRRGDGGGTNTQGVGGIVEVLRSRCKQGGKCCLNSYPVSRTGATRQAPAVFINELDNGRRSCHIRLSGGENALLAFPDSQRTARADTQGRSSAESVQTCTQMYFISLFIYFAL